jgi:hypothetical protein
MTETESISSSSSTSAESLNLNNLSIDATLTSEIEKAYDLIRRNDSEETLNSHLDTNEFINVSSLFLILNKFKAHIIKLFRQH